MSMQKLYYSLRELDQNGIDLSGLIHQLIQSSVTCYDSDAYVRVTHAENPNLFTGEFFVRLPTESLQKMEINLNRDEFFTEIFITHSILRVNDGTWWRSIENHEEEELNKAIREGDIERFVKYNPPKCSEEKLLSPRERYTISMETTTSFTCSVLDVYIKADNPVFKRLNDNTNKNIEEIGLDSFDSLRELFNEENPNHSKPLAYAVKAWFESHIKQSGNQKIGHSNRIGDWLKKELVKEGLEFSGNLIANVVAISNADAERPVNAIKVISLKEKSTSTI